MTKTILAGGNSELGQLANGGDQDSGTNLSLFGGIGSIFDGFLGPGQADGKTESIAFWVRMASSSTQGGGLLGSFTKSLSSLGSDDDDSDDDDGGDGSFIGTLAGSLLKSLIFRDL